MAKAKEAATMKGNFELNNFGDGAGDFSTYAPDGTPCIYISGE